MYKGKHEQKGNACAASALMIACHEKDQSFEVSGEKEQEIYQETCEEKETGYSSPQKIIDAANKRGWIAKLNVDPNANSFIKSKKKLYDQYGSWLEIKGQNKTSQTTADVLNSVEKGAKALVMTLVNDKGDEKMHCVLLRYEQEEGCYYVYDTAYGNNSNLELYSVDENFSIGGKFKTGRTNTYMGIMITLTPQLPQTSQSIVTK